MYGDDVFCNAVLKPYDGPKPWPRWLQKVDETVTRFTYRKFGSLFGMDITPASLVPAMEKGRWISMSEYGVYYSNSDQKLDRTVFLISSFAFVNKISLAGNSIALTIDSLKQDLLPAPKMAKHHIFPQQFKKYFNEADICIDDYTISVPQNTTHLKGIHGKGYNNMPGEWNSEWKSFITNNPTASQKDIYQFAGTLLDKYELNNLPITEY